MKKIIFFISIFLSGLSIANAANNVYSIDIDVYVDKQGNANITEVWTVDGSDGTEWYKVVGSLENSELSNFKVSMDGKSLTYKENWDVDGSLSSKKGYYGTNRGDRGLELCFGKYDYKKHVFTLNYTISNIVFNVEDAQVIYFNFIDKLTGVNFHNYTIELSSYYEFPDTLDVWAYGHKGYAYVKDGKIKMSNYEGSNMNDKYAVMLAKFPLNTFDTTNTTSKYDTFVDVHDAAKEGSYKHDYGEKSVFARVLDFVLSTGVFVLSVYGVNKVRVSLKYGYIDNKTIDKKNTPYFRDIPCNKDIYYASTLANLNGFSNETNILGAIFLKWIKQSVVTIEKDAKNKSRLILKSVSDVNNIINNTHELKLYEMVYLASKDGILEKKELGKWAKKHYREYFDLFTSIKTDGIEKLKTEGHIFKRTDKKQCKYNNVMDDLLYEESKKLYGLKLFLDEFSNMKQKEAIEVNLWNEYLMFAYIFGNAKKVMEQFKDLYPELITEMNNYNLDFDTLIFLNDISYSSVSAASSARSAAESYSSGGGGFSSGGGGGGSFGGGGGGSR